MTNHTKSYKEKYRRHRPTSKKYPHHLGLKKTTEGFIITQQTQKSISVEDTYYNWEREKIIIQQRNIKQPIKNFYKAM